MGNRILKIALALAGVFFLSLGLFLFWAVGKSLPKEAVLDVQKVQSSLQGDVGNRTITLLTYNIAHGQGIKKQPTDWRDKAYTEQKLAEITEAIKKLNPDLITTQEVDLDAHRTHHINEALWIAQGAHYPYLACAPVWDENYIPFPYWPIENHLGSIKSANCIFSRYPLSNHRRTLFEKPKNNAFWYNWAYLERGAQMVDVLVGDKTFTLLNVHLEAFDLDSRQKQARELIALLNTLKIPVIVAGDFNAIPPEAAQKTGFTDDPRLDYTQDHTIQIIRSNIGAYTEAPLTGESFPADKPDQRLDAIFAFNGIKILKGRVVNEFQSASDHLPVVATIVFQK
jgi:endonuclease/exonuclease/phosphatase family metal-dependent hydrolase